MLKVGEFVEATIEAKKKWNYTGIELVGGHEYVLTAAGQWTDGGTVCGADGYASPNQMLTATEWLRRSPRSRWFALIGALDANKHTQFEIGTARSMIMPASGILTCFANDVTWMYWNNSGSVHLSVIRTY
jgi:hypothetical protein